MIAALSVTSVSSASAENGPEFARDKYCNIFDITPACAAELEASAERLLAEPVTPTERAAANCSVPEASMSNLGGVLPGHKRVQGYGYILCDRTVAALGVHGVLYGDATSSTGEVPPIGQVSFAYGGEAAGGWSCANTYLCMMSTSVADGYGVRVCYRLENTGTTSEGWFGGKTGYDCF